MSVLDPLLRIENASRKGAHRAASQSLRRTLRAGSAGLLRAARASGATRAASQDAQTWADYIVYDIEHHPFDMNDLRAYMAGLIAGGPTRSGHRTPAVIVTLPFDGISPDAVRANSWVIKQVLACGVHGLLMVHAESPEAVKAFVEYSRYPFNTDRRRRGAGRRAARRRRPGRRRRRLGRSGARVPRHRRRRGRSTRRANCCSA